MQSPTPEEVRQAVANFDPRHQKITAGLLTVMMKNPSKVRDREWICEQLTEITLLGGDFDADSANEGIEAIQEFLKANTNELLNAAYLLFQRVAEDMRPKVSEGFTLDEAVECGLSYFAPADEEAGDGQTKR